MSNDCFPCKDYVDILVYEHGTVVAQYAAIVAGFTAVVADSSADIVESTADVADLDALLTLNHESSPHSNCRFQLRD